MLRKRTFTIQKLPYPILLHFDGDLVNSGNGGAITDVSAGFDTSAKKFGTASLYSVSNGECVVVPDSIAQYLTDDFTIDFWVKPDSALAASGISNILQFGATSSSYSDAYIPLYFVKHDSYANTYKIAPFSTSFRTIYDWIHIALVRYQDVIKLYSNGTLIGETGTITSTPAQNQIKSAILPYSGSKIDEFRFSNYAVWTSNFTPPTAPYA